MSSHATTYLTIESEAPWVAHWMKGGTTKLDHLCKNNQSVCPKCIFLFDKIRKCMQLVVSVTVTEDTACACASSTVSSEFSAERQ